MRHLVLSALLLSATVQVWAQAADAASDRVVVVGNRAQPVQWNHRETIADAINQAQPNGTVIIPSSYQGTECNPIANCNPGQVQVVDFRNGTFSIDGRSLTLVSPLVLPGGLLVNGPIGVSSIANGLYSFPDKNCANQDGSNQQAMLLCYLLSVGPVFNAGDGTQSLAYFLTKLPPSANSYSDGSVISYHAGDPVGAAWEPAAGTTITDFGIVTPALTVNGISFPYNCSLPLICATNTISFNTTSLTGQLLFANNNGQPSFASPKIVDGNSGNAVTAATYLIKCDSATTLLDRGQLLRLRSGNTAVTVPDSTGGGCLGLYGRITDESAGAVSINASGSDRFNIVDGNSASLSQTTFTIGTGQYVTYYQDTPGFYTFIKSASAGPVISAAVAITTANVTCGTGGTIDPCTAASTLTGLSYTFPNAVQTWAYSCQLIYSQHSGNATNGIGVQTATNGASNLSMVGNLYLSVTASSNAAITGVASTTTPQTVTFAPTAAADTKMFINLHGTIEGTSGSGTTFNVVGFTGLAADLLTFYRGSKCQFDKI